MRIKPSTDTPSTQPHSPQSPMPIDDHAMLQSRFERALKENPDQTKPQPNETNNQAALEAKNRLLKITQSALLRHCIRQVATSVRRLRNLLLLKIMTSSQKI